MKVVGAMALSLDLSKAFDMVRREDLLRSLQVLGAEARDIELVVQLHTDTVYHMSRGGERGTSITSNGIKQGCKLAPLLWTALTLTIMQTASDKWEVASSLLEDCLTLCADDFLHQEVFRSMGELEAILQRIDTLLQVLSNAGLEVNPAKSSVLLDLRVKDAAEPCVSTAAIHYTESPNQAP